MNSKIVRPFTGSTIIAAFACMALLGAARLHAETVETLEKTFAVAPGGMLEVDVDFGSLEIKTHANNEVAVQVVRKITRGNKADEEAFLSERPVTFSQDGNTVTVRSRAETKTTWSWKGGHRNEARYTITVPAQFDAQLKTSGGSITAREMTGKVKANTSGGGLNFAKLRGPLEGRTSSGSVRVEDCEGDLKIQTSGGTIHVSDGGGTLEGGTSGGSINVKDFHGPARVKTSGGGIRIENAEDKVEGSTSGGSINASFSSPPKGEVKLSTSGGSITLRVPESSAFDLDAATSGGSTNVELPVDIAGKPQRSRVKGPVNGGGQPVHLRTSGGGIHVKGI